MIKNRENYETRAIRLKKSVIVELNRLSDLEQRTFVNFVGIILENYVKTHNKSAKNKD